MVSAVEQFGSNVYRAYKDCPKEAGLYPVGNKKSLTFMGYS